MIYVAKIESGRVKLYNASNGAFQRSVGDSNAVSANVQGDTVAITYANGQVKIYKCSTGAFQRSL